MENIKLFTKSEGKGIFTHVMRNKLDGSQRIAHNDLSKRRMKIHLKRS